MHGTDILELSGATPTGKSATTSPAHQTQFGNALVSNRPSATKWRSTRSDAGKLVLLSAEVDEIAARERMAKSDTRQSLAAFDKDAAGRDGLSAFGITVPAAGRITVPGYALGRAASRRAG